MANMAQVSGRRKTSANKQKKSSNKRGKGRQPGQGSSVMMNNYFPSLNEAPARNGRNS